jgi:hypothetical protein
MHECYNACPSGQAGVNEKKGNKKAEAEAKTEEERQKMKRHKTEKK